MALLLVALAVGCLELNGCSSSGTTSTSAPPTLPGLGGDAVPEEVGAACPAPAGGWPERVDPAWGQTAALIAYTWDQPDKSGLWWESGLLVVAFTGDIERHRAELTALWRGPLCVLQRPRSLADLNRIAHDFSMVAGTDYGLEIVAVSVDERAGVIAADAHNPVVSDKVLRAIDQRFGKGVIAITANVTIGPA